MLLLLCCGLLCCGLLDIEGWLLLLNLLLIVVFIVILLLMSIIVVVMLLLIRSVFLCLGFVGVGVVVGLVCVEGVGDFWGVVFGVGSVVLVVGVIGMVGVFVMGLVGVLGFWLEVGVLLFMF